MAITKEKKSDGFFVYEQITIPADDSSPEAMQAFNDFLENVRNINTYLNEVETRIHKLLETPQVMVARQSTKLQKHYNKFKELNQVKSYAEIALRNLEAARRNLEKKDTAQAMIDTIFMMDAYWRGFIHTEEIKGHILRDSILTTGRKGGGNSRKKNYELCKDAVRQLANEKWKSQKIPFSVSQMADYLMKNHKESCSIEAGKNPYISKTALMGYIKELHPPRN